MEIRQRRRIYFALMVLMILSVSIFLFFLPEYTFLGTIIYSFIAFILVLCLFLDKEGLSKLPFKIPRWVFLGLALVLLSGSVFLIVYRVCGHTEKKAELIFDKYIYDFGVIRPDSLYRGSTVVKNTGNDTLRIGQIQAGCGCTEVEINKLNIAPQDTTLLSFAYNTYGKSGNQKENIFLATNADSLVYLFQFKAYVEITDNGSMSE